MLMTSCKSLYKPIKFEGYNSNPKKVEVIFYSINKNEDSISIQQKKITSSGAIILFNKDGSRKKRTSFKNGGEINLWMDYKYNNKAQLIEKTYNRIDGSVVYTTNYKYDKRGFLVESIENRENKITKTEYKYDNLYNLISKTSYKDDSLSLKVEFKYNEDQQVIENKRFSKRFNSTKIYRYTYDSLGNKSSISRYDENNVLKSIVEIKYDSRGKNILKEKYIGENREPGFKEKTTYTYDHKNNVIKSITSLLNNEKLIIEEYRYEYY